MEQEKPLYVSEKDEWILKINGSIASKGSVQNQKSCGILSVVEVVTLMLAGASGQI